MTISDEIQAFILVGGASSRMGTDKSTLLLGDLTFVDRVFEALDSIVSKTTLITSNARTIKGNKSVESDVFEGWGALGGLHAALNTCESPWAFVVACDLPLVTSALFERLAGFRFESDAVAPIQSDGTIQPLCALYRIDPCLDCATKLILSGERRPRALLGSVKSRYVEFHELEDLAGSGRFFANINTPADFEEIRRELKGDMRETIGT